MGVKAARVDETTAPARGGRRGAKEGSARGKAEVGGRAWGRCRRAARGAEKAGAMLGSWEKFVVEGTSQEGGLLCNSPARGAHVLSQRHGRTGDAMQPRGSYSRCSRWKW